MQSRIWNDILRLRKFLWVYFFLLIIEGALRKWIAPSLSTPLLIVRTPIVLVIYAIALRAYVFPRNLMMGAILSISLLSLFAGLLMLPETPIVALFGFQATFLHLPLLFIIPRVFDSSDVRRVGYWTLVLSIPLALLMIAQFVSPSSGWLNAGAGEGSSQLGSALNHVRASATFSFITGPVFFYTLVAAFLCDHLFSGGKYPLWLVSASSLSTAMAAATAGSRTLALSLLIVIACALFIGIFLQPHLLLRSIKVAVVLAFVGLVAAQLPLFNDAFHVLSVRTEGANAGEGGIEGVFNSRILNTYTEPFEKLFDANPLGQGLGVGTAGGSNLLTGETVSTLKGSWEVEWERNIFECGPFLGLAFVILRISIIVAMGWSAFFWARRNNTLPLLLYCGCFTGLLQGNFGQATTVGFSVFIGGLCLASMRPSGQLSTSEDMVRSASSQSHTELAAQILRKQTP